MTQTLATASTNLLDAFNTCIGLLAEAPSRENDERRLPLQALKRQAEQVLADMLKAPLPVQQAQAQADAPQPALVQQHMSVNDTPVDARWDNPKAEPRLPRVDPGWAPNPAPASKPIGWGS